MSSDNDSLSPHLYGCTLYYKPHSEVQNVHRALGNSYTANDFRVSLFELFYTKCEILHINATYKTL